MTCEDYESDEQSLLVKGARRLARLLTSHPSRRCAKLVPRHVRAALVVLLSATANLLSS